MGLLREVLSRLTRSTGADRPARARSRAPWGGRDPDPSDYGRAGAPTPDLEALVTAAEIAAATGAAPEGEPTGNGPDGSEVDLGRLVVRTWRLANGDRFLVSLGNCSSPDAARLSMDRVAELERPLDGVGERGLVHVERPRTGGASEVGVTALSGNFTLSLVHTSTEGRTDPEPLAELLRVALTRL